MMSKFWYRRQAGYRIGAWLPGALVGLALLVAGCGHRTELPLETRGGTIPPSNTYRVKQVWDGFGAASDVLLTSGSQVFVALPDSGQVVGYYRSSPEPRPNGVVITGGRPSYLAEVSGRELVIADLDPAGGGSVRIVDLRSLTEVAAFTDTAWVEIGGVAADDSSHVYVSDRALSRVLKYSREGEFLVQLADEGSGAGYVDAPAGLEWRPGRVLVADSGKNWVQVLDPWIPNAAEFFLTGIDSPLGVFQGVSDVAGDEEDNVYVADTALGAVLKYTGDPEFDQRVDANAPEGSEGHLTAPVALSASATLVFVLDRDSGKIVTFELDR